MIDKACAQCGAMFVSKREHGNFCSTLCRVVMSRQIQPLAREGYTCAAGVSAVRSIVGRQEDRRCVLLSGVSNGGVDRGATSARSLIRNGLNGYCYGSSSKGRPHWGTRKPAIGLGIIKLNLRILLRVLPSNLGSIGDRTTALADYF
jgi:hypothetical protein